MDRDVRPLRVVEALKKAAFFGVTYNFEYVIITFHPVRITEIEFKFGHNHFARFAKIKTSLSEACDELIIDFYTNIRGVTEIFNGCLTEFFANVFDGIPGDETFEGDGIDEDEETVFPLTEVRFPGIVKVPIVGDVRVRSRRRPAAQKPAKPSKSTERRFGI